MQESQYEILEAALNVMVKGPASFQAALAAARCLLASTEKWAAPTSAFT